MHSGFTFDDVIGAAESSIDREMSESVILDQAVAIFCNHKFQRHLSDEPRDLTLIQKEPVLPLAFGLHPKKIVPEMENGSLRADFVHNLLHLLSQEKVVAFGEVGLDNTVPEEQFGEPYSRYCIRFVLFYRNGAFQLWFIADKDRETEMFRG